jgi:chloramphenicol 3-O phosphotransferase
MPNIIFLNGATGSGKTALARELQRLLEDPYLHVDVNDIVRLLPERFRPAYAQEDMPAQIEPAVWGFHRCLAAFASAGNHLVVEHALQDIAWLQDCAARLAEFPVLFVGVHCPLEELERREAELGRERGRARREFSRVHAIGLYDLEVDTSVCTPRECALQIQEALHDLAEVGAFQHLAAVLPLPATE